MANNFNCILFIIISNLLNYKSPPPIRANMIHLFFVVRTRVLRRLLITGLGIDLSVTRAS